MIVSLQLYKTNHNSTLIYNLIKGAIMIFDINTREDNPELLVQPLEVNDALTQLLIKIENTLFTKKGEVLGISNFGVNLEELLFSIIYNEAAIESRITSQIQTFCVQQSTNYSIRTKVKFFVQENRTGALVDIYIDDVRLLSALF